MSETTPVSKIIGQYGRQYTNRITIVFPLQHDTKALKPYGPLDRVLGKMDDIMIDHFNPTSPAYSPGCCSSRKPGRCFTPPTSSDQVSVMNARLVSSSWIKSWTREVLFTDLALKGRNFTQELFPRPRKRDGLSIIDPHSPITCLTPTSSTTCHSTNGSYTPLPDSLKCQAH